MQKQKRRRKNVPQYLVDKLIRFQRDFFYTIEATPEQVAGSLRSVSTETDKTFIEERKPRLIVSNVIQTQSDWRFEILAQRATTTAYEDSARAEGEIYYDNKYTYLEGSIGVEGFRFWSYIIGLTAIGIIFVLIALSFSMSLERVGFMIALAYGALLFALGSQMHEDRNYLYDLIEEAIHYVYVDSDEPENQNEAFASQEESQDGQAQA